MLQKWPVLPTLALALFLTATSTFAQERLRFAWAGFSPTNSPVWVIDERKLLQKQGLALFFRGGIR